MSKPLISRIDPVAVAIILFWVGLAIFMGVLIAIFGLRAMGRTAEENSKKTEMVQQAAISCALEGGDRYDASIALNDWSDAADIFICQYPDGSRKKLAG